MTTQPLATTPAPMPAPAATPTMADPLAGLHALHTPPPISWWPPAPGWWLLAALLLAALLWLTVYSRKRRQRNHYRQLARRELDLLINHQQATTAAINDLFKRVALHTYGRQAVSALHGEAWVNFLRQQCPGLGNPNALQILAQGPYSRKAERDASADLLEACRQWLQKHKPELQATAPGVNHADT